MLLPDNDAGGNVGGDIDPKALGGQSAEEGAAQKSQIEKDVETAKAAEEVKVETFYDVEKVPESLKASFKEMQKAYTQKTQGIANVRKQAEAFQQLAGNPNFQTWAEKNFVGEPEAGAPATTGGATGTESGEFVTEEEQKMKDLETRQATLEESIEISKNETLLDKLAAKYPDFDKFQTQIWALIQDGTSYEAAYHQAKYGGSESEAKKQMRAEILKEQEAEKKAGLEGVGPSGSMLTKEGSKTIQEAYESAKEGYKE